MHALPSDIRYEDERCVKFLQSLHNFKSRNEHMWDKYIAIGYAFAITPKSSKFKDLLDKYWIYPPGGRNGYHASLRDMGWTR